MMSACPARQAARLQKLTNEVGVTPHDTRPSRRLDGRHVDSPEVRGVITPEAT
jgi:hypothetical protein